MARIGQSSPDSGLGVELTVLETFQVVPSLLGSNSGVDLSAVCKEVFVILP